MQTCASNENELDPQTRDYYHQVLVTLNASQVPFLVGGAYAFGCYTGITRNTKDLDVFCHPNDATRILQVLANAGFQTELTDRVWLAKAFHGEDLVDVIFSSGNGIATVDDEWFTHAVEGKLMGAPTRLIPREEMIWSKSFVMTRERYDGADIAHILRAHGDDLDWDRLLRRFGPHYAVLYNHLILFGYIYPSERARVPAQVMAELADRLRNELAGPPPHTHVCQGTLLSSSQYEIDIARWDYIDARPFSTK